MKGDYLPDNLFFHSQIQKIDSYHKPLSTIILDLSRQKLSLNSIYMETTTYREEPKINWAADFTINEPLHDTASALSGVYTRICFNFPDNPLTEYWHKQGVEWHRYYSNLYKMSFNTHEEGEVEIKRISKICREMLELEQDLLKKSGQID